MKLKLAATITIFFFVLITQKSFADSSEFFWQVPGGQNAFTAALEYDGSKQTVYSGGVQNSQGPTLHLAYDYGFTEDFDFGASTNYTNLSQYKPGAATNLSGLGDFVFFMKAKANLDPVSFKYGFELALSPNNMRKKSSGDLNNYSGRSRFTPFIGAEVAMDVFYFGLKLTDDIALSDIKEDIDSTGATDALNGGNALSFRMFAEVNYGKGQLGLKFERIITSALNDKTTSTYTGVPASTGVALYGTMNMGAITLISQLKYAKLSSTFTNGGGTDWNYQVGAHLSF